MKNESKEEVRTAEEVLRDCSDGIAYESWKRKHNATLKWILAAMEEYAKSEVSEYSQAYQLRQSALVNELYARITELEESQFKSQSEAVGGVIAMYDFLLEENCELREKLKRYEH